MKIIYVDLDGVVADFEKGKKEHPLGNVTPYKGRPDKLPGVYENLDLSWNFLYQEIELFNPKIRFLPVRVNKVGIETTENPLEWKTELFLPYKLD